jgi:hypothetical protein
MERVEKITVIVASKHVSVDNKNYSNASCDINPVYALGLHLKKYATNER